MNEQQKILLVDDEVSVRNLYQLYFEANGYSVVTVASIAEALRHLRDEDFAVAIIDIFLYGENGLDLLLGISAARPNFPVIIMSVLGSDQPQFQQATEAGAKAVFTKLLPLNQLLAAVRQTLGQGMT